METKERVGFTPGPWRSTIRGDYFDDGGAAGAITIEGDLQAKCNGEPDPTLICALRIYPTWDGPSMQKANAALITAAPDLLAACQLILDTLNERYDGLPDGKTTWMGRYIDRLQAVVDKATQST